MRLKAFIEEDFVNYKKPSMFLGSCFCTFKCCKEANLPFSTCQNCDLYSAEIIEIKNHTLIERFKNNPITEAIVIGGMEPLDQFEELLSLIKDFRESGIANEFVIYTGYNKYEITEKIQELKKSSNIIVKYGRFIPNDEKRFDKVLGVNLISSNQYAEKL